MKIKLCGFTDIDSINVAVENKCDFLGFVFYDKSPRNIDLSKAILITKNIPKTIQKVAVLVDPNQLFLDEIIEKFKPDFLQFHGSETIDFLKTVKQKFPLIKIIKAFKINDSGDLKAVNDFANFCDFFLFDAKEAGSGKKFDWKILQNFDFKKDFFLSGGININNIEEALQISGAKLLDISSGIEEVRGKKSPKLIKELMDKFNQINNVLKS